MNRQKVFNSIVEHLAAQGGPALNDENDCVYRGPHGRKCAVGFLIPDSKYAADLEGFSPYHDKFKSRLPDIYSDHGFFRDVQSAHDEASRSGVNGTAVWSCVWESSGIARRLESVASKYGLSADAVARAFYGAAQ